MTLFKTQYFGQNILYLTHLSYVLLISSWYVLICSIAWSFISSCGALSLESSCLLRPSSALFVCEVGSIYLVGSIFFIYKLDKKATSRIMFGHCPNAHNIAGSYSIHIFLVPSNLFLIFPTKPYWWH